MNEGMVDFVIKKEFQFCCEQNKSHTKTHYDFHLKGYLRVRKEEVSRMIDAGLFQTYDSYGYGLD